MLELFTLAKFASYGKAVLAWIVTIPWYVLVIAALVLALLFTWHEESVAKTKAAQLQASVNNYKAAQAVDLKSIGDLKDAVTADAANVSAYQTSMAQVQTAAAAAKAQAVQEAQGRQTALQALKAAQARPVVNDCTAPPAHGIAKDQL